MEDRINEVLAEDSLDDSKADEDRLGKEDAKGSISFEKRSEEERTIKIVMGAKPSPPKNKAKLDPPKSDIKSPRSKLKLSGRLKPPPNVDENKSAPCSETDKQSKSSIREYEAVTLQMAENPTPTARSFRKNNSFASELEHTRMRTNHERSTNIKSTQMLESSEKVKPERQEFQIFYEQETNYSFWSFICSREIHVAKKIANAVYLVLFILTSTFSVVSLVYYTDSECRQSIGVSVVYYIYFGLSMLLKFSMYIFLQLELHGKVIYTLKFPHLIPLWISFVTPGLLVGIYAFDYKTCSSINKVLGSTATISMLSIRFGITLVVFASVVILSTMVFSLLNKFNKQAVKSFIKGWNSLLQLLCFLILLSLLIISVMIYCTQIPWKNIGLLFELITSLSLLLSCGVIAILSKKRRCNILQMPPKTEDEKYEEKEILNAEQ